MCGKRVFDLEFLVSCIVLAGFLRNMDQFYDTLRFAVFAAIADMSLRKHILDCMAIPHLAFCIIEQRRHAVLLREGCVRYSTVDSSPQGHRDWVLQGARTISLRSIIEAMEDADRLCRPETSADDRTTIGKRLDRLLNLTQGVPTAVGSQPSCSSADALAW